MTDEEAKAECLYILEMQRKHPSSRDLTVDNGIKWGEWLDVAQSSLDSDCYDDYRWMCERGPTVEPDYSEWVDRLEDFALAATRSCYGMGGGNA